MKTIRQILAIARTEFRFGLRRGAPVVVTTLIGLLLAAGILISAGDNLQMADASMDRFTPEQIERLEDAGITAKVYRSLARDQYADLTVIDTPGAWFLLYLALLLLPVATAGAIPADRQYGAYELLRSMPVRAASYLIGKILGSLGIVLCVAGITFALFLTIIEGILLANYGFGIPWALLWFYLQLGLLDGLPVLVFATTVGVLAGTAFPSRRSALLPGLLTGGLATAFWLAAFRSPDVPFTTFDRVAYFVFQNCPRIWAVSWNRYASPDNQAATAADLLGAEAPVVGGMQVLAIYGAVLVVLAGAFLLARLWLKNRDHFE